MISNRVATNKAKKNRNVVSYHSQKNRLQVGDVVTACVGPPKETKKGKRAQGRERRYGEILNGVANNTYLVAFEDMQLLELTSHQLRKVRNEDEVLRFKQVLSHIVDHHINYNENENVDECSGNQVNDQGDDESNAPFRLAGLMDETNNQVEKMIEEDHPSFDICSNESFNDENEMTAPTSVDPSPFPNHLPSPHLPNSKTTTSKSGASKHKKKKKKTSSTTKNNEGIKVDNIYQTRLNEANEKVAATVGTTYTVRSSADEMDWLVISDYGVLQTTVKPRQVEYLGIKDLKAREHIKESPIPLADLFLQLSFLNGEWERKLEMMNKAIVKENDTIIRSRRQSAHSCKKQNKSKIVPEFSKPEFLIGMAIVIGAADCSEKGCNLWVSKSEEEWEKCWVSVAAKNDFGVHMRYYRFQQFRTFYPKIWEDDGLRKAMDPWWKFEGAIRQFNEIRKKIILPSEVIAVDESMSAWRPQSTAKGGLPNLSFIMRKPEDLGIEFKSAVCPILGIMTFLEIQRGKDDMKKSEYFSEIGATASCGLRAAKACSHKTGEGPEELVLGDSWFGSVKAAVAQAQAGFECTFQVKQNHSLYPKKQIEEILGDAPGGASVVLTGIHSTGIQLVAVGYKYNSKTILNFVCTDGAGTTKEGKPYEMKWTDEFGNVNVRTVPRPYVVSNFFEHCNSVDIHNHLRQSCLKLEKKWVTTDCWFRLSTTLMGINVVDTFRLAKFHNMLPPAKGRSLNLVLNDVDADDTNIFSMKKFAGILSTQLLYKAHNLRENITHNSSGDDDELVNGKEQKKKRAANKGEQKKSASNQTKRKVIVLDEISSDESLDAQLERIIKKRKDVKRKYLVGGNRFKCIEPESENTVGSTSTVNTLEEGDFVPTFKFLHDHYSKDQILHTMRDVASSTHTAVKLDSTVSLGENTKGRQYAKRRKCKWCGKRTTVKCFECDQTYCFSLRKGALSCFHFHVNGIKRVSRVARRTRNK